MVKKLDLDIDQIFSLKKSQKNAEPQSKISKTERPEKDGKQKDILQLDSINKINKVAGNVSSIQKSNKNKKKNKKKNSAATKTSIEGSENDPLRDEESKIDKISGDNTLISSEDSKKEKKERKVMVVDATGRGSNPLNKEIDSQLKIKNPALSQDKDDPFADIRGSNPRINEDNMRVFYYDDLRIGEGEGGK
ncbi:hypothetical protein AYI68_g6623 [Smittium mucronatum]|uniref:Uncharacterized protein n=1 Tax=Smittium mucronatum TaxID=133383 RepID=A0A1R0GQY7_9FUNG|nr:hypothetical protein AYI68_g6623 [Smittium mucronatum]